MPPAAIERAAQALLAARRNRRPIVALAADDRPETVADGYAIQVRFAELMGEPVVGWKIGCTSAAARTILGIDHPFAGRVFPSGMLDSPACLAAADFPLRGIEAEFAFRLAVDLVPRAAPYERAEIAGAIDRVHPAIEIIEPAFAADSWYEIGAASTIADNGAHGALVLAPPVDPIDAGDLARQPVVLHINGVVRREGSGAEALGHPLDAVAWLASDLSRRGIGLSAGQVVTTGTCSSFHTLDSGDEAIAKFPGLGSVSVRFAD